MGILADRIRKKSAERIGAPTGGQTEGAFKQMIAKSGKAPTAQVSGQSSTQEDIANAQAQTRQQTVKQMEQANAQNVALAEQKQKMDNDAKEAERNLMEDKFNSEMNLKFDDLSRKVTRSDDDLADREDAMELEHMGFILAMQDKEYQAQLEDMGARNRLDDEKTHKENIARVTIGGNMSNLLDAMDFARDQGQLERAFKEKNNILDFNSAIQVVEAAAADAQEAAYIGGIANIAGESIKYGMSKKDPKPEGEA